MIYQNDSRNGKNSNRTLFYLTTLKDGNYITKYPGLDFRGTAPNLERADNSTVFELFQNIF